MKYSRFSGVNNLLFLSDEKSSDLPDADPPLSCFSDASGMQPLQKGLRLSILWRQWKIASSRTRLVS
jgi:hypothetical protein